jgi:hypothetical protein
MNTANGREQNKLDRLNHLSPDGSGEVGFGELIVILELHQQGFERLAPVGLRQPPERRCVSLLMALRGARVPYGLPAQAATKGVPFGCR